MKEWCLERKYYLRLRVKGVLEHFSYLANVFIFVGTKKAIAYKLYIKADL